MKRVGLSPLGRAGLLIFSYAVVTGLVLVRHEPWRDEAQAWLIVRDLGVGGIIRQMGFEGSPALWHLLLLPLAKSGLPYESELLLHWLLAVTAVGIFVLKAPFSWVTKMVFVFSYYMVFEYAIIARCYILTVLLLFCIAALYRQRFSRPLLYAACVALLFNTNTLSWGAAFGLLVSYGLEGFDMYRRGARSKDLRAPAAAVLVMALGGALAYLQVLSPGDGFQHGLVNPYFGSRSFQEAGERLTLVVANLFVPGMGLTQSAPWLGLLLSAAAVCIVLLWACRCRFAAVFVGLSVTWLSYVFLAQHAGGTRHHGLLLIILLVAAWIVRDHYRGVAARDRYLEAAGGFLLLGALVLGLFPACCCLANQYRWAFSGAKEVAEYLWENRLEHCTIVGHPCYAASALGPYLPRDVLWYPTRRAYGSYMCAFSSEQWQRRDPEKLSVDEVVKRLHEAFPDTTHVLLLVNQPLTREQSRGFRLLYKNRVPVFWARDEDFYLYERVRNSFGQ